MDQVAFNCEKCNQRLLATGNAIGKHVQCPRCGTIQLACEPPPATHLPQMTGRPVELVTQAPSQQMREWYFSVDGEIHGPVSLSELSLAAADGRIRPHTLVRRTDSSEWMPAQLVTELGTSLSVRSWQRAVASPFFVLNESEVKALRSTRATRLREYAREFVAKRFPDETVLLSISVHPIQYLVSLPFLRWLALQLKSNLTGELVGAIVTWLIWDIFGAVGGVCALAILIVYALWLWGSSESRSAVVVTSQRLLWLRFASSSLTTRTCVEAGFVEMKQIRRVRQSWLGRRLFVLLFDSPYQIAIRVRSYRLCRALRKLPDLLKFAERLRLGKAIRDQLVAEIRQQEAKDRESSRYYQMLWMGRVDARTLQSFGLRDQG